MAVYPDAYFILSFWEFNHSELFKKESSKLHSCMLTSLIFLLLKKKVKLHIHQSPWLLYHLKIGMGFPASLQQIHN